MVICGSEWLSVVGSVCLRKEVVVSGNELLSAVGVVVCGSEWLSVVGSSILRWE